MRLALALAVVLAASLFVPRAHAQGGFYVGFNKVQHHEADWRVLETEHLDLYFDAEAEALAEIAAAEAEAAYADLVHRFGFTLTERVPFVVYATNQQFRTTNVLPGLIPPGVGGFYEFLKGRVVIPADGDLGSFRRVIRHELVHVFTFNYLARVMRDHRRPIASMPPLWFTEGIAEYWSGEPDHQAAMVLRDAVASNYLIPLADLHRYGGFLLYKQGEAACRFLSETYGEEVLLLLMDNTWRDPDFRRVMEHVLGEPMATVSERYDAWLREAVMPSLPEAVPPSLAADAVAAEGFAAKPLTITRPDGTTAVAYVGNRGGYTNLYLVELDSTGAPASRPRALVRGERSARFEMLHAFESRLDVTPDGRTLAFTTQSGPSDAIHLVDLGTERVTATLRFPDLIGLYGPAFSPDGRRIAFTGIHRSGMADLYLYDRDAEALARLTDDPYDDRSPAFTPDGRTLVFSSDRTDFGPQGGYNLFSLDLDSGAIRYLTYGHQVDLSPRVAPDGREVLFISARRGPDGAFGGHDVWSVSLVPEPVAEPLAELTAAPDAIPNEPVERRLTAFTSAVFDPSRAADGALVFTAYDGGRFTIRRLEPAAPVSVAPVGLAAREPVVPWVVPRRAAVEGTPTRRPYRRRYTLDAAEGALQTNPVWGTTGGAVLAFSDLLGDDRLFVTLYQADVPGSSFIDGLNFGLSRIHLGRRADVGYGLYRFSGLRFDRTDPSADASYPILFEQLAGGFGLVRFPLSRFQRIELSGSLAWNEKEIGLIGERQEALLYSQSVALTHDTALYGWNGPVGGWKTQLTAAYTTDLRFSTVSYFTLSADARHYARLAPEITLASWGLARFNVGREARLWLLGGSWDLRGYPFLRVRGQNQWFTSHELRFPLVFAPGASLPVLAPFGIVNLRGALFVDAARAWNDAYDQREAQLLTGRTLGSAGTGLRMNLFGGLVLRYDIGWRFEDGFVWDERRPFSQFFFGYDF